MEENITLFSIKVLPFFSTFQVCNLRQTNKYIEFLFKLSTKSGHLGETSSILDPLLTCCSILINLCGIHVDLLLVVLLAYLIGMYLSRELKRLVAYARSRANLFTKLILEDQTDSCRWGVCEKLLSDVIPLLVFRLYALLQCYFPLLVPFPDTVETEAYPRLLVRVFLTPFNFCIFPK